MNQDLLQQHIASGMVREQSHQTLPLRILNYSPECQYERRWDEVTLACRGLVMSGSEIVARPFRKFFNEGEYSPHEIPWHLESRITEKLDGSLLIWFCFEGEWIVATRGSFTSSQARVGRDLLLGQYSTEDFDDRYTYLFEVIYPENRIVVNYGSRREVVLLAVIETATGIEIEPDADIFSVVSSLPPDTPAKELRSLIRDDEEGYVVRFSNGFRMKVKGERYIYLHKVLSGISSRMVWGTLSTGNSLVEMLELVPDECAAWIRSYSDRLNSAFSDIASRAAKVAESVSGLATRKEQAAVITAQNRDIAAVCFSMLDGKDWRRVIWNALYPPFERPEILSEVPHDPT